MAHLCASHACVYTDLPVQTSGRTGGWASWHQCTDCGRPSHAYRQPTILTEGHTVMHTYIHTYIHKCIHTYIHACIHAYKHARIPTYIQHTYIHHRGHTHTHTYMRPCMRDGLQTQTHTLRHTCVQTFIQISINTYKYIEKHPSTHDRSDMSESEMHPYMFAPSAVMLPNRRDCRHTDVYVCMIALRQSDI